MNDYVSGNAHNFLSHQLTGFLELSLAAVAILAALYAASTFRLSTRTADKVCVAAIFGLAAVFAYSLLTLFVSDDEIRLALWAALGVASVIVGYAVGRWRPAVKVLAVFLIAAHVTAVPGSVEAVISTLGPDDAHSASVRVGPGADELGALRSASGGKPPNVYVVLMDAYLRHDLMADDFEGFEASAFESDLAELGFRVATGSTSNYPNTRVSLGSLLAMEYPVTAENQEGIDGDKPFQPADHRGPVAQHFNDLGYRLVFAVDDGPISIGCGRDPDAVPLSERHAVGDKDFWTFCIAPGGNQLDDTLLSFLVRTPVADMLRVFAPEIVKNRNFTELPTVTAQLPAQLDRPAFVFAHFLLPHLPGRYTAECERRTSESLLIGDAQAQSVKNDYLQNYLCAQKQMMEFARKVSAEDPDAIIIFMSDHGTWFKLLELPRVVNTKPYKAEMGGRWMAETSKNADAGTVQQMFGNLTAARLPARCQDLFYESISLVNLFEMVFSCLENRAPRYKPDRNFIVDYAGANVREVTHIVQGRGPRTNAAASDLP